jgi:multiple RNA-binding domain-containing protein 1
MTENSLRDIFNQKGEVTDVRIQKTKSGKSREFAFIGYRTEQQAIDAQRYFNNTFLQTSRVTVDLAKSIHDPLLLLSSKSRYTKNKLIKQNHLLKKEEEEERKKQREQQKQQQRQQTKQGGGGGGGTESQERAKAEFLSVMKSRSQSNVWGNDDVHIHLAQERQQQQATQAQDSDNESDNDSESDNNSSDYNEPKPINKATTKTKAKNDFHDLESDSDSAEESGSEDGIVKGKSNSSSVKAFSDLDFLRGKVKKNITEDSESDSDQDDEKDSSDSSEEASEVEEEEEEDNQPKTKKKKVVTVELESEEMNVSAPPQDTGVENEEDEGRLFIRNLPYSVSEEELTELFSRYGPLSQVRNFSEFSSPLSVSLSHLASLSSRLSHHQGPSPFERGQAWQRLWFRSIYDS